MSVQLFRDLSKGENDMEVINDDFMQVYPQLLLDIHRGMVLCDDVGKYREVLEAYKSPTSELPESLREIQENEWVACNERITWFEEVCKSHGGWNILCATLQEVEEDSDSGAFLYYAVKSNDIAHYLLLKERAQEELSIPQIEALAANVLQHAPQNLGFYLTEFPDQISEQLQKFIDGDTQLFWGMEYNKHTRAFMKRLLPHLQRSPEVRVKLQEMVADMAARGSKRYLGTAEYLGLVTS
jgi:hypothetical protein